MILSAAACCIAAAHVSAQAIRGRVVEDGTGRPVPGAFVVLTATDGLRSGGSLSASDGTFLVRADTAGVYRLVVERIGYETTVSAELSLRSGEQLSYTMVVSVNAIDLETVGVVTTSRCRRGAGTGVGTAQLWQEVRKALEIVRWGEQRRALRMRVVSTRRELDAATLRVASEETTPKEGFYDGSPYRSIPLDQLQRHGYVQRMPEGDYEYYAPDAAVLLSDGFLERHCFRVEPGPQDEAHLIGLAFEPLGDAELPDVAGVLWVEAGSAELKRIEYRYTNLPFAHGDWPQVGGRVDFIRLANGMWIVNDWYIRMPSAGVRRRTDEPGPGARTLTRLWEVGGRVQSVRTLSGDLIAEAAGATVFGTAFDSTVNTPLAGASVQVLGTDRETVTGADGTYRLNGLSGGAYALRLRHPRLDLLGIRIEPVDVELNAGRAERVALAIPSFARVAMMACQSPPGGPGTLALIYGVVSDPAGAAPVPGAALYLRIGTGDRRLSADSTGVYRACVEPRHAYVRIAATLPGQPAREAEFKQLDLRGSSVIRADLNVARSAVAQLASPRAWRGSEWSNAIVGLVLENESRDPIVAAAVTLSDPAGEVVASTLTDDGGRFRILHPGGGVSYVLSVEHVAFRRAESRVVFPTALEVELEVLLSVRAVELDPIVVTGRRRGYLAGAGFYDRMRRPGGLFIDESEIEKRNASKLTDLFRGRPGIDVVRAGLNEDVRITTAGRLAGDCQPALWLDGSRVRDGGTPKVTNTSRGTVQIDPYLSDIASPNLVAGIEIYRRVSEIPVQYGGSSSACGVIVIWTRR